MKKNIWVFVLISFCSILFALSVSAASTVEVSTVGGLQSAHPYMNSTDETWVYAHPYSAESLEVTFSAETETETNYDFLYIYDANDNLVGKYSGSVLAGETVEVTGNTFKIRLTSDGSVQRFGFAVTKISASGHSHCICGENNCTENSHSSISCEAWTSNDSLPDSGGVYYLTADVHLSATWDVPEEAVTLCLNGFDIVLTASSGSVIKFQESGDLTVTDCSDEITYGNIDEETSLWVPASSSGDCNLIGGVITGGKYGGVYSLASIRFAFFGGNIAGNTSTNGGGINLNNDHGVRGELLIDGGSIIGNTAAGIGSYWGEGGGLYIWNDADVKITNGTISHNTAGTGGGIYYEGYSAIYGSVMLEDSEISCNSSGIYVEYGIVNAVNSVIACNLNRGIYLGTNSQLNMTGGSIRDNTIITYSSDYNSMGGGIYLDKNSTATLDNVTISGNTAASIRRSTSNISGGDMIAEGGGMYIAGKATLRDSRVTGNHARADDEKNNASYRAMGGGIYVASTGTAVLQNTSVDMNEACSYSSVGLLNFITVIGGGIAVEGGTLTVHNGTVTGNKVTSPYAFSKSPSRFNDSIYGGGIYSNTDITIGGTVQIKKNTRGTDTERADSNTNFPNGKVFQVSNDVPLVNPAKIYVEIIRSSPPASPIAVTGNNSRNFASYFAGDNGYRAINTGTGSSQMVGLEYIIVNADAPLISVQPKSAVYAVNEVPAALTVKATGDVLTYQWYKNTVNSTTGGTAIAGATGASYTPSTTTAGTSYYYVVITNTNNEVNGNKTATAVSTAAKIAVNETAVLKDGYYEIANANQLYWFAEQVNAGRTEINGKLVADILINEGNVISSSTDYEQPGYRKWKMIGSYENTYTGIFDGNGHTISGMYFYCPDYTAAQEWGSSASMFYSIQGEVRDLTLENSFFYHYDCAAALAYRNYGKIENCTVNAWMFCANYKGGIVYTNESGASITDSSFTGSIRGQTADSSKSRTYGGICSTNNGTLLRCTNSAYIVDGGGICRYNSGIVQDCRNYGDINSWDWECGGICATNNGIISDCYNEGEVNLYNEGTVRYISGGGICGENRGVIERCGNLADVYSDQTGSVGGICGRNSGDELEEVRIKDSYNTGNIDSREGTSGGIAGSNLALIIGCYHKDGNLYFYNDKSGAICGNNEYNVVKDGSTGKIAYIQKGVLRNCIDFRYSDGYAVGTSEENAVVSNVCSSTRLYGVNPAYHLNGFISGDFTNWRQNIDNGLPKDDYPVLDSEHGIVYRISSGSYSNTPSSETLPEDLIASGNSGPNIEWSLDKNGVLTLKGYGDMPDYSYGEPGWFPYRELIHQVTFEGSITSVGSHAFHDYVNLEYVALPDQMNACTQIGPHAFTNCSSLQKIFIHSDISGTEVGNYAFYGCSSLHTAGIPRITVLGRSTFEGCTSLKSVYINSSQHSSYVSTDITVDSWTFRDVNATVYLPGSMKMNSLAGTHNGTILSENVKYGLCGNDVYWTLDESGVLTLSGTGSPASYQSGTYTPWTNLRDEITSIVVDEGVMGLPSYIFEYAVNAETVTLPFTLKSIALNAFNDCENLNNIFLPASLTEIDSDACFNRCSELTDVYYEGTEEESLQISGFSQLHIYQGFYSDKVTVHFLEWNDSTATCTQEGIEGYYSFDDISVYDYKYNADKERIASLGTIPARGHSYTNMKSEQMASEANCQNASMYYVKCDRCSEISSVVLIPYGTPNSEKHSYTDYILDSNNITETAICDYGCGSTDIRIKGGKAKGTCGKNGDNLIWELDEDGTLTISGEGEMEDWVMNQLTESSAPWFCVRQNIKKVILTEGITSLGSCAFCHATELEKIILPSTLTSIGEGALYYCSSLSNVDIPDSVTSIGRTVFYKTSITDIVLPKYLTEVSEYLFYHCEKLRNVVLPEGITSIGEYAFSECAELEIIQMPENVTYIGKYAFRNAVSLKEIYFNGNTPALEGEYVFQNTHENFTIYYNSTASGWNTPEWNGYPAYPFIPENFLGDINGDKIIDNNDLNILVRYFAGWNGYAEQILNPGVADVNGDGKLTRADAMILARHLAEWEGYQTLPIMDEKVAD